MQIIVVNCVDLLNGVNNNISTGNLIDVSWIEVAVLLMIAVLLLALISYLTRYLSKE